MCQRLTVHINMDFNCNKFLDLNKDPRREISFGCQLVGYGSNSFIHLSASHSWPLPVQLCTRSSISQSVSRLISWSVSHPASHLIRRWVTQSARRWVSRLDDGAFWQYNTIQYNTIQSVTQFSQSTSQSVGRTVIKWGLSCRSVCQSNSQPINKLASRLIGNSVDLSLWLLVTLRNKLICLSDFLGEFMSIYMNVSLLPLQIIYHSTHPCCLYPYFLKVTVLMLSVLESVLTWQIEKITIFFNRLVT